MTSIRVGQDCCILTGHINLKIHWIERGCRWAKTHAAIEVVLFGRIGYSVKREILQVEMYQLMDNDVRLVFVHLRARERGEHIVLDLWATSTEYIGLWRIRGPGPERRTEKDDGRSWEVEGYNGAETTDEVGIRRHERVSVSCIRGHAGEMRLLKVLRIW